MQRIEEIGSRFRRVTAPAQRCVALHLSKADQPFVGPCLGHIEAERLCGRIMAGQLTGRFDCASV